MNGDGEDAGVVYCEMTARENTSYSITRDAMRHLMWPGSGYSAETGGKVEALRSSCSWEKVVAYHRQFYRPSGVCLVVVGEVAEDALLVALRPVHDKIVSKGPAFWPAGERAWTAPQRTLAETVRRSVEFPSDDEATGIVRVEWHTVPLADHYTRSAVEALLTCAQPGQPHAPALCQRASLLRAEWECVSAGTSRTRPLQSSRGRLLRRTPLWRGPCIRRLRSPIQPRADLHSIVYPRRRSTLLSRV